MAQSGLRKPCRERQFGAVGVGFVAVAAALATMARVNRREQAEIDVHRLEGLRLGHDGSVADMCGNGARCFARYVRKTTGLDRDFTFETAAGIIAASFDGERVTVNLTKPKELKLNLSVPLVSGNVTIHSLNTGVPHAVQYVPDADKAMVLQHGAEIRKHAHFGPRGPNVNFVQVLGKNHIRVRTFERGVEGETLACGTGVSASAIISARIHGFTSPVKVLVQGGDELEVSFKESGGEFDGVRLTGPADFAFTGRIEI